jgi:cysteine-rich repeat protein
VLRRFVAAACLLVACGGEDASTPAASASVTSGGGTGGQGGTAGGGGAPEGGGGAGFCGDRTVQAALGETCDDGNDASGDGCAHCVRIALPIGGGYHGCVLVDGGTVKCWGLGAAGQLGLGDNESRGDAPSEMGDALAAVDLGSGRSATSLAVGYEHTCALLDDGSVKCWGLGVYGQLGLGDGESRGDGPGEMGDALTAVDLGTGHTATAIAAGSGHTCAVLDDGSVKCWGYNASGQLGLGDVDDRGDDPGEMGDALAVVDLGSGHTAQAIGASELHSCALLDDDSVKCWGFNPRGELGVGDIESRGDEPGEMGDALPAVPLGAGRTAAAIACGSEHDCALLDDATVKCWGGNQLGQLGQGDTDKRGDEPGELGDALPAIDLGSGRSALRVESRGLHTCALLDDATVKCWGFALFGQLGLGSTQNRGDAPGEMGDALPALPVGGGHAIAAITTGWYHSCALRDDATLVCWGGNEHGQLGLGDTLARGDQPGEVGDALPALLLP